MRRSTLRTAAVAIAAVGLLAGLVGGGVVVAGLYDVSADRPHTQPVYSLLEYAMRRSVRRQAQSIDDRPLDAPTLVQRGAACFAAHCSSCHGAPGIAPTAAGITMQPLPTPLVDAAARWRPRELVWLTRHGIRMSGMPAWATRLPDDDIWAVVAFLQRLPAMSPADYRAWLAGSGGQAAVLASCPAATGPASIASEPPSARERVEAGRLALGRYACQGCHTIPGVVGARPKVGPPLAGFARQTLIAGRLVNTRENLVAWIREPQRFDAASAMPSLGVGEADAQAMADYLSTLR